MIKLCFVVPRTYMFFNENAKQSKDKVGGAQKQTYYLSTALAENNNFDIHFLVADFGQADFEEIKNVKIWKSFNFSHNIFKRTIKLLKILKKIDADTYIFRSADVGVAFAAFYIKLFLKKKLLYMIALDIEISNKTQIKYNGLISTIAMQFVYKKANVITAQTKKQSEMFYKYRNRKPDAIIKNIYLQETEYFIDNKDKDIVLWVGRLSEIKNPQLFFDLAKKYPKEQFVIIAPIILENPEYGNKIQKIAKQIKNLIYIDYVKPSEIKLLYKKAKIYVMTSAFEGFSNTMAEAMMEKCPVLSYKVNPDNILTEYRCGFCAEKDLNKFYSYFEDLLNDNELRKQYGQNGAKYIRENHQKDIIITEFTKLLTIFKSRE